MLLVISEPISGTINNYSSLDAPARKGPQNKTYRHTDN